MTAFSSLGARLYRWVYGRPKSNRVIVEQAGLSGNDTVLDVGCGPGAAVALAAEQIGASRVAAADPTPGFIEAIRRRIPEVDAHVASAESLPFDEGSFSVIWSVAAMHHWDDRDAGLKEVVSKLAPRGRLLLMERRLKKPGHGITDQQADEVGRLLRDLGMTDVKTSIPDGKHRLVSAVKGPAE
jgi:ubiquinone/menaquinone biosynthesis C-methylase UbiE